MRALVFGYRLRVFVVRSSLAMRRKTERQIAVWFEQRWHTRGREPSRTHLAPHGSVQVEKSSGLQSGAVDDHHLVPPPAINAFKSPSARSRPWAVSSDSELTHGPYLWKRLAFKSAQ